MSRRSPVYGVIARAVAAGEDYDMGAHRMVVDFVEKEQKAGRSPSAEVLAAYTRARAALGPVAPDPTNYATVRVVSIERAGK